MKEVLINALAVVIYGILMGVALYGISGGDMLLYFLFIVMILFHILIILRRGNKKLYKLTGIIIGIIICVILLKSNELARQQKETRITPLVIKLYGI